MVLFSHGTTTITWLTVLGLLLGLRKASAQDSTQTETVAPKPPVQLFTEVGLSVSTASRTPFWLRANQYGIRPNAAPFLSVRMGVRADYGVGKNRQTGTHRHITWGYGFESVGNVASQSAILIPEAYLRGSWRGLEVRIGRRREIVGLADSTLGSGSYIGSENALPMPKIQISLAEYTPVGFTKGLIAFRGLYAHGWFGNRGPVTHSYLHQKALYGRLGKPTWPVRFYGGFNHQVQWAGRSEVITDDAVIKNGRFPGGFKNYLNVVTGLSLAAKGDAVDTTEYSKNDRGNRVGNHLGTVDLGVEILAKRFSLLVYRQSIYEDGSLYYLTNIADGLNGIRFRNRVRSRRDWDLETVVVEFLYTKSQGGADFTYENKKRGSDNYFNHGQYMDGWSYQGRTLGTPFIPPARDTDADLPRPYSGQLPFFTNNNRLWALYLGIEGRFREKYTVQFRASLSDNAGTYNQPFPVKVRQFSGLLAVSFPVSWWNGMLATVSAAADQGKLYLNSTGIYVSLRKNWR